MLLRSGRVVAAAPAAPAAAPAALAVAAPAAELPTVTWEAPSPRTRMWMALWVANDEEEEDDGDLTDDEEEEDDGDLTDDEDECVCVHVCVCGF
jgi:hypothetical protein